MDKIRWGVLSTAKIGTEKVIPALKRCRLGTVEAIASRDIRKAGAVAGTLVIPRPYGSYEELLADPDVDAVYNPLPNPLHVPWSIKALEAGKHVLCEKPIAPTAAEAQTLVDAARKHPRLRVMEAFMYRFHPQWLRARDIVKAARIGELRTIQTLFSYHNVDPNNIRNRADAAGGALMDIGCYPISLSRFIFGAEPARVSGIMEFDPRFKTDRLTSAVLDFGRGTSTFTVGTQLAPFQRVHIFGTTGRIEIEIPFNTLPDRSARLWHQEGREVKEIAIDPCDQYTLQADAFAEAALNGGPVPTPIEDAVANMKVIDAVVRSARSGGWEVP